MTGRRYEEMVITAWVMTVSTIQLFVVVVLAATLIDELSLTRWQIGVLGAVNTGVGAVFAPALGRLADRMGARRAMMAVVVVSAAGLVLSAAAFDYWLLVVASAVAGIPQGAGNTVTNKVIAEEVPTEAQGAVTGVKQSGVQLAVFLSGALLPASAATIGWRPALLVMAAITSATLVVMWWRFPPGAVVDATTGVVERGGEAKPPLDPFVYRVALYALALGMTAGGVTRFYPLFAQEVLGFTEARAGLAVSLTGLAAIVARLVWARLVDRVVPSATALRMLAIGAAITTGLLLVAESVAGWILWPTVLLAAFTVVAWNVVAMLSVIRLVPTRQSGQATGVVLMGFLGGLTVSAPLVGFAVDRLDSYRPAWVALGALAVVGAVIVRPPDGASTSE